MGQRTRKTVQRAVELDLYSEERLPGERTKRTKVIKTADELRHEAVGRQRRAQWLMKPGPRKDTDVGIIKKHREREKGKHW